LGYNAFFESKNSVIRERLWQEPSGIMCRARYEALFGAENDDIGPQNTFFWNLNAK